MVAKHFSKLQSRWVISKLNKVNFSVVSLINICDMISTYPSIYMHTWHRGWRVGVNRWYWRVMMGTFVRRGEMLILTRVETVFKPPPSPCPHPLLRGRYIVIDWPCPSPHLPSKYHFVCSGMGKFGFVSENFNAVILQIMTQFDLNMD